VKKLHHGKGGLDAPECSRKKAFLEEARAVADRIGVPLLELPKALKGRYGPGLANAFLCYCTYDERSAAGRFIAAKETG